MCHLSLAALLDVSFFVTSCAWLFKCLRHRSFSSEPSFDNVFCKHWWWSWLCDTHMIKCGYRSSTFAMEFNSLCLRHLLSFPPNTAGSGTWLQSVMHKWSLQPQKYMWSFISIQFKSASILRERAFLWSVGFSTSGAGQLSAINSWYFQRCGLCRSSKDSKSKPNTLRKQPPFRAHRRNSYCLASTGNLLWKDSLIHIILLRSNA